MSTQEALDKSDVIRMDLEELKRTTADFDVDAAEIDFPSMTHHMTVRGKLEALADSGAISLDEMQEAYDRWKSQP